MHILFVIPRVSNFGAPARPNPYFGRNELNEPAKHKKEPDMPNVIWESSS